jgi:PAS domain S-box-containing protein
VGQQPRPAEPAAQDNDRLGELLRNVRALIWTIDASFHPAFLAGDAEPITGYTNTEVQDPIRWRSWIHVDDVERVSAEHADLFRSGRPYDIEYRFRRKDGTWIWLNDRASHVYVRDGVQYVDGMTYDITQRKQDELQQIEAAQFGRRAVLAGDVRALLTDACATIHEVLAVHSSSALWRESDGRFSFIATAGEPVPLPTRVADEPSRLAGYAFRANGAVAYADLSMATRFRAPALLEAGIRSGISAPVHGRSVRYGILSAQSMQVRLFTDRECAFVQTIANVAADAIERIEAERALESVGERYAQVVQSAEQGICTIEDGRITFANAALARMAGRSVEELTGLPFASLATASDRERLEAFIAEDATAEPSKIEVELAASGGEPWWAIVTTSRLRAGKATLALVTDITDVRRRQAQLADAQSIAHVGSFEVDLQTGAVDASDELYRIAGLAPQSRPLTLDILAPFAAPDKLATLAAGEILDIEHPLIRADGTRIIVHTRAHRLADGKRAIGITRDVTTQRAAQDALAEREARLQLIVSRLPILLWSTDTQMRIVSVIGAGFQTIDLGHLDLLPEDVVGAPPAGISMEDALEGRTVSYDTQSGTRELRVHIEPLRDRLGTITGTAGFAFDRTEQQRTERVLSSIAYGAVSKIGDDFFSSAVLGLAGVLHVPCAFIARIEEGDLMRSVAVARDGEIVDNFLAQIAGTPCERMLNGVACWIERGVRREFPRDALLRELDAEAYAGVPILDASGKAVGLVAIVDRAARPRTPAAEAALRIYADRAAVELDRLQYERSLVDEKEYVENLIETANVVIIEIDSNGDVRLVNRAFELLTGYSRDEVEGRPLLDILSDASPLDHLITTGSHQMEGYVLTRAGEARLLRLRANDVRRAGRAVGTLLFGIDITEARRAEEEQERLKHQLTRAAEEWRTTFDSVLTPIFLVDAAGRVTRVNHATSSVTGRPYAELIGMQLDAVGEGEPFHTAASMLKWPEVKAEGGATAEASDHEGRTWTINILPLAARRGAASSIVVLWDISRIVALQESVRLNEQMSIMGQLVA